MKQLIKEIKQNKAILSVIFSICCFTMLILYVITPDIEFSDMENRYLMGMPKVKWASIADGTFMNDFDTFTKEQIPFRNMLIRVKAVCESSLLKMENDSIIVGKKGHLFEKLLSYDKQLFKNEQIIEMFAQKSGRDISVAIIPNSFEILKDLLPNGVPNVSEEEEIDAFYSAMSAYENVNTIDVYKMLKENASESLYYKTDHHWTTDSAYLGYKAICDAKGLEAVSLDTLNKKQIDNFYGTYYAKYKGAFISPDVIEYYEIPIDKMELNNKEVGTLYDMDKAGTYDKYAMFMYGNNGISTVYSSNSKEKNRELIIFKDSYANCMIPFLTYNYDTITVIDLRYYGGKVSELLNQHEDADILLLYNFMHFNEDNHFYRLTT